MPDYQYDVFISYHRGQRLVPGGDWPLGPDGRWVHDVFFPAFQHWMDQEYPGVRIAFDRDLQPGAFWDQTLRRWVRESKCMVAVWNPLYFRSGNCRSEFHSMYARQKQFTPPEADGPRLVLPVVYADGKWFDPEAGQVQFSKNFSAYSMYERPIVNEEVRTGFVTALQEFCRSVSDAIQKTPPFQPNFPWCDALPLPPAHAYPVPSLR